MAFIRRLRNQNWLFPPTIADLIGEDHICRLVDDVVENIDFKSIEGRYDDPGSPAYHPKVMMKLLIQGTIDGIRSSRKISKATKENVVYMYLSDRLNPDSRTICRFMKENLDIIKRVIAEIAKLAREIGMVKLGHLSIHGTKIKASASNFSVLSKEELDEMKNKKHFSEFSYNPQVTVDAEHGIVVAEEVVQNVRDVEQLQPQIEQIEDVFGKLPKNTIISADNDYHSAENIDFLKEHELDGYMPPEKLASKMQGKTKEPGRFDLACIAHNLKRIWAIKSQTEASGGNSPKNGCIDQSSLKNMYRSIKGVWSQILSSFSKCLNIYQV